MGGGGCGPQRPVLLLRWVRAAIGLQRDKNPLVLKKYAKQSKSFICIVCHLSHSIYGQMKIRIYVN
jgi:hypothetical protein